MMSESKYTPIARQSWISGPFGDVWVADDVEFVDGKWRERVAEPRIVLTISPVLPDAEKDQVRSVAAAAPDMLEALKHARLVAVTRGDAAIYDAAIAKAEGHDHA